VLIHPYSATHLLGNNFWGVGEEVAIDAHITIYTINTYITIDKRYFFTYTMISEYQSNIKRY
jgi:hypothetical protein